MKRRENGFEFLKCVVFVSTLEAPECENVVTEWTVQTDRKSVV